METVVLMKEECDHIRDNHIRIRKSKKRNIGANNDLKNTTHKNKDQATRTLLKTGVELRSSGGCFVTCTHLHVFNMR